MIRFNSFRAKDPVLAALIAAGLLFSTPLIGRAQTGPAQAGWEEVGPAARTAQTQLMMAPPKVVAQPLGQANYRAPVEPPRQSQNAGSAVRSQEGFYVVKAGDTLPKIAMRVYGNPDKWQDLMVLNNIENGNRIYVGQKLVTHSNESSANRAAAAQAVQQMARANHQEEFDIPDHEIDESPAPSISADAAEADASFYGQVGGGYVVKRGDTLGKIAKRILGSTKRWREIARANPQINPNNLRVGDKLTIPGAEPVETVMAPPMVTPVVAPPMYEAPRAMNNPTAPSVQVQYAQPYQVAQAPMAAVEPSVSEPSFDPPPLMPPPPPPVSNEPYGMRPPEPQVMDTYAPPQAPPMYSSGNMMTPPPAPMSSDLTPPPAPYMSAPIPAPSMAPSAPVAVGTRELYREERYRIPDEMKPTDFSPYFANLRGYHGLFEVESALIPYISTWHVGFQYKYEKYQYLNGVQNVIEGNESYMPLHIMYTGKKLFAGLTVPFQSWEVSQSGGGNTVSLSGIHDPSLKVGYQIWKNLEGTHAVTLHVEGKFPGDNYHQPLANMTGKSRTGVRVGPAEATRGAWVEIGGAYSGKVNDRWNSHLNVSLANDSEDSIAKYILRAGMDYRVNHNFSIVGEINNTTYEMDNGPDDTNTDLLLGFLIFNGDWQGQIGFPIALEKDWGYGHDVGVVFGVNHRWD